MPEPPPVFCVKYAIFSVAKIFHLVKMPPTDYELSRALPWLLAIIAEQNPGQLFWIQLSYT